MQWASVGADGWHAVSVPITIGAVIMTALGEDTGGVIQDTLARRLAWLIPAGGATGYRPPGDSIVVITDGGRLHVPGLARRDLIWWCLPPEPGRPLLTQADHLIAAIAAATAGRRPR
ncbi:hypothetical protein GCM10023324_43660 [Streptomyces youssoufiensis]